MHAEQAPGRAPRSTVAVFSLALLLVVVACGGKVEPDISAPAVAAADTQAETCPVASTTDPLENCTRYCQSYGCVDCVSGIPQCEQSCVRSYGDGHLQEACLACAIDHAGEITSRLSCEALLSPGEDGGETFSITFPEAACGAVCSGRPNGG
jgi:hypothetical protein